MKKTKMLVALLLVLMFVFPFVLTACDQHVCGDKCPICGKCQTICTEKACRDKCLGHDFEGEYAAGTELRMATGYNSAETGITFSAKIAGSGITLADGKEYHTGDLKPTWVELENILKVQFADIYKGNSAAKEWAAWKDQLENVDMISGTASDLNIAGAAGKVVNIAEYLDKMPNFKQYLEDNPIVRLSITGSTENGAIYFSPYFDGVNDIERMPLMRADMLIEMLDGEGEYAAISDSKHANRELSAASYQPYMPTEGKVSVDSLNADGTGVVSITKDYSKYGNIIAKMNEKLAAGKLTGVEAINMFREYIDKTYNGLYGTTRSDLFLGYNACWDADEMVAALRCIVATRNWTHTVTDKDGNETEVTGSIAGLFSRETANNQRQVDLFRFAGSLFGVRGLESRQDYLFVGADGKLHDARQEADTYVALERMNAICQEGLIIMDGTAASTNYLELDGGFMSYDYNQTQTVMNDTKLNKDGDANEKYIAIMVPVARWNDGTEKYMRFTESWRSVKTDGWAISAAGVAGNADKLNAALALIDYAYSYKGQILMSYGPDAFIKTDDNGDYVTFDFNGKKMPEIADATYAELQKLTNGNYTNYARQYLGSTLSFVKSQAFEYQCTSTIGKEGSAVLSAAIKYGVIVHPELALANNPWYTSVPTVLPHTQTENDAIGQFSELSSSGNFSQSKGGYNLLLDIIQNGYHSEKVPAATSATVTANLVNTTWKGSSYLEYKQAAWERLQDYYNSLNK